MWVPIKEKYKITYAFSRTFAGNAGKDVDVSLEVVTNVQPEQLSLGLVNVGNSPNTLDRVEKAPIIAISGSGNSVVVAARFQSLPSGTYAAVVSDGVDGAKTDDIVVS